MASATSKPRSVLARTLKSGFRILFVGVLGSFKFKGTVWAESEGFLSIPGMSSTLGVSLSIWKLPESWDLLLLFLFESVGLERATGPGSTGSESRDWLGGSVTVLETEGGGEVRGFRAGLWGLAVITGLLRGRGDCLDTEGVGGEKEQEDRVSGKRVDDAKVEETRSSDRFLAGSLSTRRMESCVAENFGQKQYYNIKLCQVRNK